MTDADKIIFEEMRLMRKEANDNFVLLHQKVDKNQKEMQKQITENKESFIVFKAKWFGVGAAAIFIGNLVKPAIEFFKINN